MYGYVPRCRQFRNAYIEQGNMHRRHSPNLHPRAVRAERQQSAIVLSFTLDTRGRLQTDIICIPSSVQESPRIPDRPAILTAVAHRPVGGSHLCPRDLRALHLLRRSSRLPRRGPPPDRTRRGRCLQGRAWRQDNAADLHRWYADRRRQRLAPPYGTRVQDPPAPTYTVAPTPFTTAILMALAASQAAPDGALDAPGGRMGWTFAMFLLGYPEDRGSQTLCRPLLRLRSPRKALGAIYQTPQVHNPNKGDHDLRSVSGRVTRGYCQNGEDVECVAEKSAYEAVLLPINL